MLKLILTSTFIGLTGCMNGPGFMGENKASSRSDASNEEDVAAKVLEEIEGVVAAEFSASANTTQFLNASADSTINGTKISIQPNSLAIDTTISVEEGGNLASGTLLQKMTGNAALGVNATTNTVMVTPSIPIDLIQPMNILISIPDSSGLVQIDNPALVVFYKIYKKSEDKWYAGYITREKLKIVGSFVEFPTLHFGSFQAFLLTMET